MIKKSILNETIILTILLTIILIGCTGDPNQNVEPQNPYLESEIIYGKGTIKFINLEGGFFGIVGEDGKKFDPIDLNDKFKQDGLRVRFKLKLTSDVLTIRMWGTPVEIVEIEKLE